MQREDAVTEHPAFDPYDPGCPSRQLVDRIGDRWTVLVIGVLAEGPARYGELATRVAGISPKMLAQTLKALERDGLVTREAFNTVPPRVEYALTTMGEQLMERMMPLMQWVLANADAMVGAGRAQPASAS